MEEKIFEGIVMLRESVEILSEKNSDHKIFANLFEKNMNDGTHERIISIGSGFDAFQRDSMIMGISKDFSDEIDRSKYGHVFCISITLENNFQEMTVAEFYVQKKMNLSDFLHYEEDFERGFFSNIFYLIKKKFRP